MRASDVFVIGGGPAGLAAAIAARRKGLTVTLADGASPPIDKACGEGLMPDGVAALRRLGIEIDTAGSHPFRGIRFLSHGISVEADFQEGCGLGVRRTVLHTRMVEEAEAAGVRLLWSTPVIGICSDGVRTKDRIEPARWIVGADGFNSRVRRWAGLDVRMPNRRRFGFRIHYRVAPWTRYMELHWGSGCQIYVTPVGPREVCCALISRDSHMRMEEALDQLPQVAERLNGAAGITREAGAVTANCRLPRVCGGGIALAGDASGCVDAITGEGLSLAFQQALALAESLASGDLAAYQAAHRRLNRRPLLMARLMLAMDRSNLLRDGVLHVMAGQPALFRKMLSLHIGAPQHSYAALAQTDSTAHATLK